MDSYGLSFKMWTSPGYFLHVPSNKGKDRNPSCTGGRAGLGCVGCSESQGDRESGASAKRSPWWRWWRLIVLIYVYDIYIYIRVWVCATYTYIIYLYLFILCLIVLFIFIFIFACVCVCVFDRWLVGGQTLRTATFWHRSWWISTLTNCWPWSNGFEDTENSQRIADQV